jgi:peptide/nickel transport system permease protein
MKLPRTVRAWILVLAGMHGVISCAGFFAPYDPAEQDRDHPYSPPSTIHFRDLRGSMHFRPFVYPLRLEEGSLDRYAEDTARAIPVQFFVAGARYRLMGLLPSRLHLFGGDGARVTLLGTDGYGRDQFSRLLWGGQISLLAGLVATGLALACGLLVGATAGFCGGWTDEILMRLAELFLALPWLYLLFALRAFLPLTVSPLEAFFLVAGVVGLVGWARPARLVRGVVLSAKERDFVRAARGFGASGIYILRRHILPQTASVLLTQAAILAPQFVLAEVTLSFLGLGVPEPAPSWGNLLANLQQYSVLTSYWWMSIPALALTPFFLGYLGLASALQRWTGPSKMEAAGPRSWRRP